MSREYRQKLLNWFSSVALVLMAGILALSFAWFIDIPNWLENVPASDLIDFVGPSSDSLLLYPLLFPIILFWHFWDFLQKPVATRLWGLKLAGYRIFLLTFSVSILLFLLMDLDLFQYNSCDELDGAFHFECIVRPALWLMIPWVAATVMTLILCIIKAGFSIRSLLKKDQ